MLVTEAGRPLASHELLLSKPGGGVPSPLIARKRAARNRESPSPWLPSVPDPNQPRPCARSNCSTISDTSRYRTTVAFCRPGLMVTVNLDPDVFHDAPPLFGVTSTGIRKSTSSATLANQALI